MENKLEKVLVCVEDVNLDAHVIEYTHMIAKTVGLKTVYLLHVIHDTPLESRLAIASEVEGTSKLDLDRQYHDEIVRLTTGYTDAMTGAAVRHFGDIDGIHQEVKVFVGNQLKDTLMVAHDEDIDLIVMGRHLGARLEMGDVAILPRRVTRKSTCSVLVVPEEFVPRLTKIFCPIRDSRCSTLALQTAIDLGIAFNAEIHALNLFQVYNDIHYPGGAPDPVEPREKKIETATFFAKRECDALKRKIHTANAKITFDCRVDETFHPANVFEREIEARHCDLVVIGARGRSGAAGVLLGSVTEQLIKQCSVPVLATKHKGEHIGILKAMLALFGRD
ncbi:MAG: universal stress protein [Deltaproteobacteria bacterium]|nr:universal stress protein [Deltaproteobacteria bacterium]